VTHNYLIREYDSGKSVMMSSSNEADLHEDSLDLDDDKPSRAHASDEGDTYLCSEIESFKYYICILWLFTC